MCQLKDNKNSPLRKYLTYKEREKIAGFTEQGYSNRAITRILKRAPQTINNDSNQGTVCIIKHMITISIFS